jgi:hypothetical protein
MKSRVTAKFWTGYNNLPPEIQELAIKQYRLWSTDPNHRSVRFKKVGDYWSARVTDDYRALGIMADDEVVWFFIGRHAVYDRKIK